MVTNNELDQALAHISNLVNFAYEQGYHEHGYDPVEVVRTELARRSTSGSELTSPITPQNCPNKLQSERTSGSDGTAASDTGSGQ